MRIPTSAEVFEPCAPPFYYLLEAAGLVVWLVNARDVKHVPGRPKSDKLDSVWLCKLNERGMLRPSFIPPVQILALRDYTRLRFDLIGERTHHIQRLEKLLEELIKLSAVVTDLMGVSSRAMLAALIAGQRDPQALADLAKGRLRVKQAALVEALTGRFDAHHGELASVLLGQIDTLNEQIAGLDERIDQLLADMPAAQPPAGGGANSNGEPAYPCAADRLDEITGIGRHTRRPTSPRSAPTWACSPPTHTWSPGPRCARAQASPVPDPRREDGQGQPLPQGRARRGRRQCRTHPHPTREPIPTPRPAHRQEQGTGRDHAHDPDHRVGNRSPTPPPVTTTSAKTSTTSESNPSAPSATTSTNSKHSATKSPSSPRRSHDYQPNEQLLSGQSPGHRWEVGHRRRRHRHGEIARMNWGSAASVTRQGVRFGRTWLTH
ncbi:IS110 family transposase [Leekyejoonella antrihumi]|uniref:IS110 family transposase n=1 Tax=Leekyejoonella antrihumi TaxID=1660198 RepID=UPI0016480B02|nr:transposase [Leekyejoonella antrihumi]